MIEKKNFRLTVKSNRKPESKLPAVQTPHQDWWLCFPVHCVFTFSKAYCLRFSTMTCKIRLFFFKTTLILIWLQWVNKLIKSTSAIWSKHIYKETPANVTSHYLQIKTAYHFKHVTVTWLTFPPGPRRERFPFIHRGTCD